MLASPCKHHPDIVLHLFTFSCQQNIFVNLICFLHFRVHSFCVLIRIISQTSVTRGWPCLPLIYLTQPHRHHHHNHITTIINTTPTPSKWWESFSSSPPPLPHHHWKFHEVEPWSMSNHAFLSLISHTKIPTLNSSNSRNYSFSHKNTPWWPSGRCLCFRIVQSNTLNCRSCFLRHDNAGRERWQPPPIPPFCVGEFGMWGHLPSNRPASKVIRAFSVADGVQIDLTVKCVLET